MKSSLSSASKSYLSSSPSSSSLFCFVILFFSFHSSFFATMFQLYNFNITQRKIHNVMLAIYIFILKFRIIIIIKMKYEEVENLFIFFKCNDIMMCFFFSFIRNAPITNPMRKKNNNRTTQCCCWKGAKKNMLMIAMDFFFSNVYTNYCRRRWW